MGRKRGGRNAGTPERIEAVAQKVLEEGKTLNVAAEELGVHRVTASRLLHQGLADEEIKARVQRSRDRLVKMLSLSDGAYLRILKYNHPDNFSNQEKVASKIYKTMGLIREEPIITINNIVPVRVEVDGKTFDFTPNHKEDE